MAAVGDAEGNPFPWGSHMKQFNLNYRMQQKDTTPVGIYPEGESVFGVADLLGNVWEWTADRKADRHILKGGSWNTMHELQDWTFDKVIDIRAGNGQDREGSTRENRIFVPNGAN